MKYEIERIDHVDFTPTRHAPDVIDVESVMDIVNKLNAVIDYINNKEREQK